jgi:DNA repair protein RadC
MAVAIQRRIPAHNTAHAAGLPDPGPTVDGELLPRERLERHGCEALRDEELLAVLLGTGYRGRTVHDLARSILEIHSREDLAAMDLLALAQIKGLGRAKACLLVAAFELARRSLRRELGTRPVLVTPEDVLPLLADIRDQPKEHFLCLYLNGRNQLIHKEVVSIGSLSASIVHPREVFRLAVSTVAASVILAHNHPSGDVAPSQEDVELTRRLTQAGELMGINVLDHIIISAIDYLSLKERGVL